MARFEIKLPKMGESVAEATIISWLKNVGDHIEMDEAIVEIATDKVDSEVPSDVEGTLVELLFEANAVVKVGETIAIIETLGENAEEKVAATDTEEITNEAATIEEEVDKAIETTTFGKVSDSGKFFSPLVRNIAITEGISMEELEAIIGTGKDDRVTKNDILAYIESGRSAARPVHKEITAAVQQPTATETVKAVAPISVSGEDEIIEMSRMGKMVAHHMVASVQTSAHVQSFIEVDVTNIVKWRDRVKDQFFAREGEKITYTPIFMMAVANTIKKFPMINISVDGDKIIKRKAINLGMAASLADGNLIVPVIKNADQLNLVGMTKAVNDLADRARKGQLKPDDIQGGTYTVTNVGSFGSVFGTPIINQPQVAILALGAVRKVAAVIETPDGDFIGIRHKMFISHSYDHRVVNGALGGMFIKAVKESLEAWDLKADF
ncbi:MAG TPA: dihydrolipoamide acetyltransferase family protein [Lutibacter sp.]|nr:dihydrolipoamide acetyltransferase family protein [Lutibacter sp.]